MALKLAPHWHRGHICLSSGALGWEVVGTAWLTSSCGEVTLLTLVLGCPAVEQMADEAAGVLHPDAVQKLKEAAPATSGLHHLAQQAHNSTRTRGGRQHQPGEPPQVRSRRLPQPAGIQHCGGALHLLARHMTGCKRPAATLSAPSDAAAAAHPHHSLECPSGAAERHHALRLLHIKARPLSGSCLQCAVAVTAPNEAALLC